MSTPLMLPPTFGPLSTKFQGIADDALDAGITGGFSVISYRGKTWAIKSAGTETPLMRPDGDGPRASIDVVIVKSSPYISKVYYKDGYEQGSDAAPDCFSNNGVVPDESVVHKVNPNCATCPMNAWGSRKNAASGKDGKACADSKRLAVMPVDDLDDVAGTGPMLLRVPAASLQDTARYAKQLKGYGYNYFGVGTRISFDVNESYPKFVYAGLRALNDVEADKVIALRNDAQTDMILNAVDPTQVASDAKPPAGTPFIEPTKPVVVAATATPKPDAVVATPAQTAPVDDPAATIAAQIEALKAQLAANAAGAVKEAIAQPGPSAAELELAAIKAKIAEEQRVAAEVKAKAEAEAADKAAKAEAKRLAKEAKAKADAEAAAQQVTQQAAPMTELEKLQAQLEALQAKSTPAPAAIETSAPEAPLTGEVLAPGAIDDALARLIG